MKVTRHPKIQSWILAAALSVGLGFVSPVSAKQRHYILDINSQGLTALGTLGGDTIASDINEAGQVVGGSKPATLGTHAFITGPNGLGMTDLGTLGGGESIALGINDAGRVAGYSVTATGAVHAFITGPNGMGMTDLGTLGGGSSIALGINDTGQVVGYSGTAADVSDTVSHVFITGANGVGMTDLGRQGYLDGAGINDAGQVVWAPAGRGHSFITGPNGVGRHRSRDAGRRVQFRP